MLIALISASLAAESSPTPFFRGAPSSAPIGAGHVNASVSSAASVVSGRTDFGGNVSSTVGITDRLALTGSFSNLSYELDGKVYGQNWGAVSARYDVVQTDRVRVGGWVKAGYGLPAVSTYGDAPVFDLSLGVSANVRKGIWTLDTSLNVLTVPFAEAEDATNESLLRLVDVRFVNTFDLTDNGALRIGVEPLPYVSYRHRVVDGFYVEPVLGVLMGGIKVEAAI